MTRKKFKYQSRPATVSSAKILQVANLSADKILENMLRRHLLHILRMSIYQSHFKKPPFALIQSARVFIKGSKVKLQVMHPAARYHDQGVRRHAMTYLRGVGAIPIREEGGRVVFRTAPTSRLLADQWIHPGMEGKDFMGRADTAAKEFLRKEMAPLIAKKLLPILRGKK